jgi:hypothetical protein
MRREILNVTTDASGDGSATGSAVFGTLYAMQLVDGTFDDGVDITVTTEQGDLSVSQLVKADFNTDSIYYPRVLQNLNTDGTALTTHCEPLVVGRVKVVVAQGGNVKSGSFIFYIRDHI